MSLPIPAGTNAGRCSSCGAPVLWARTGKGKAMPLDRRPVGDGNTVIENGLAVAYQALLHSALDRYKPHFATCPHGKEWSGSTRRRGPRR